MSKGYEHERLKQKFLNLENKGNYDQGLYSIDAIAALANMAKNDVYPDWRFGDNDYVVWSMIHSVTHSAITVTIEEGQK